MRRLLFIVVSLFVLTSTSAITVSLIDPSDYPLESNSPFSVTVSLYNEGVVKIEDYSIGVKAEYPFKEVSGETYFHKIGDLNAKKAAYKTFRLLTYDEVPEGNYDLKTYVCEGTCASKRFFSLGLQFTGGADVQLVNYSFNESHLIPGSVAALTLNLKNYGTAKAKDASVNVSNLVSGKVLFVFMDKPSNYYLGDIGINKEREVEFTLLVNENLTKNVYSMPIKATYDDDEYNLSHIDFDVISLADIKIIKVETDPIQLFEGRTFTVMVEIENTGRGQSESTKVILSGNFTGEKISYIGTLDENEDDIALLRVISSNTSDYTIRVVYTDDLGEHYVEEDLALTFLTLPPESYTNQLLVLIAAVLIVSYLVFRKVLKKIAKKP